MRIDQENPGSVFHWQHYTADFTHARVPSAEISRRQRVGRRSVPDIHARRSGLNRGTVQVECLEQIRLAAGSQRTEVE
jgi:hypothetical protein